MKTSNERRGTIMLSIVLIGLRAICVRSTAIAVFFVLALLLPVMGCPPPNSGGGTVSSHGCTMNSECDEPNNTPCEKAPGKCDTMRHVCVFDSACTANQVCFEDKCCASAEPCACGKRDCSGQCKQPSNLGQACGCGGVIQCDGNCSKAGPSGSCGVCGSPMCDGGCTKPTPSNLGQPCGCGARGKYDCDGKCVDDCPSATPKCNNGKCCVGNEGSACGCGGLAKLNCDGSCPEVCAKGETCIDNRCSICSSDKPVLCSTETWRTPHCCAHDRVCCGLDFCCPKGDSCINDKCSSSK
jgi:hypothetical protein